MHLSLSLYFSYARKSRTRGLVWPTLVPAWPFTDDKYIYCIPNNSIEEQSQSRALSNANEARNQSTDAAVTD